MQGVNFDENNLYFFTFFKAMNAWIDVVEHINYEVKNEGKDKELYNLNEKVKEFSNLVINENI